MPRPIRVLAYARVSSEAQARGSSLRDQEAAISAYAKTRGLEVTRYYREAESSLREKAELREQIRALTADVRAGDLVLCDKIDRWSRDPEFSYSSIRQILEAKASFYAVGDACDPSTPEGDTMLNFRVLFAREEHKRIKLRMVGTRHLLRDAGYYVEGRAPFGYRRSLPKGIRGPEKNLLVVCDAEAETVREVYHLSANGNPAARVAALTGLSVNQIRAVLGTRVYLGEVRNREGVWIRARHAPIVDADLFARSVAAVGSRVRGRKGEDESRTADWLLRGLVWCPCGARHYARYGATHYSYFMCSRRCGAVAIPVSEAEETIGPLVVARLEELREVLSVARTPPKARLVPDVASRRDRLAGKRARLLDAFGDGLSTKEELRAALAKLDAEGQKLDAEEAASAKANPLEDTQARRKTLASVETMGRAWRRATPRHRREIVRSVAARAELSRGSPPVFTWYTPEEMAVECGLQFVEPNK